MNTFSRMLKLIVASLALSACGGGGGGDGGDAGAPRNPQTPPPPAGVIGDGGLEALVDWARASQDVPAMATVVVVQGQAVEMAAAGRRSASDTVPVTVDDRWHLGSLTKAMTATLAGVLVEQSVIGWDTRPLDVWPELDQTIQPAFRDITLKHLLSHTSGLVRPDEWPASIEDDAPGDTVSKRRAWAAELLATPPAGPVGKSRYSNGGYVVAGAMLETVTGTPWEQLISEQVFAPLGMHETSFGAPGNPSELDQPWGHWDRGSHFEPVAPGPGADNPQVVGPAGTVHATLNDYAQFMLAHIAGARGMPGLLTAETFETLHTPLDAGSALGWGYDAHEPWAEGPQLAHSGSNLRWYAVVLLAPALDAGALFVVNAGDDRADAAISALGDLVLERFQASRL